MAAKVAHASNFNKGVKQITTCKRLGRARKYLQKFILFLQNQPCPILNPDPRLLDPDPISDRFFMDHPKDNTAVIWDPQAWFDAKRQEGFTATEIRELRSTFEDYWKKAGRRRRPLIGGKVKKN